MTGFWGSVTSSIDWCELNYSHSPYIAEFYNTLSSGIISLYALLGIYQLSWKFGSNDYHRQVIRKENWLWILNFAYASLFVVGIGSMAFHATLTYVNQLLDEIPMIYTSLINLFILIKVGEDSKGRGGVLHHYRGIRKLIPYLLVAYGIFVSVSIIFIQDQPKILQVSYGALVIYMVIHSIYLIYSKYQNPKSTETFSWQQPDVYTFVFAFCCFLTGYLCWVLERFNCENGQSFFGLQLHSIWHIITGLGVYTWSQFLIGKLLEGRGYKYEKYNFIIIPSLYAQPSNSINLKSRSE
ncbi:alkaline dihydroceramidase [Tieghemostelium lacteum]|uniref:Alkaline dihydroceramidase n=1 Tax=Tieghemostelium lacteum TaxID=361077 RepID=A0A151ZFY0_TIELA|nr:alkaline dihydroceramidase [Tieghemostelium lacteum]|eukprot:KYQ92881.1 alkaline dihydroceramidase [Tieghemostelium lacteum]